MRTFRKSTFKAVLATDTASNALENDANRKFLMIQNIGTNDIWFTFGSTAVASSGGHKICSGDVLVLDAWVATGFLSVVCTSGQTSTLAITYAKSN